MDCCWCIIIICQKYTFYWILRVRAGPDWSAEKGPALVRTGLSGPHLSRYPIQSVAERNAIIGSCYHVTVIWYSASAPRFSTLKMASKIALQCILCRKEIASGYRVYLKSGKEPLESVKEVLMTIPGRSEEHIDKFLSGAVCCKAVCSKRKSANLLNSFLKLSPLLYKIITWYTFKMPHQWWLLQVSRSLSEGLWKTSTHFLLVKSTSGVVKMKRYSPDTISSFVSSSSLPNTLIAFNPFLSRL